MNYGPYSDYDYRPMNEPNEEQSFVRFFHFSPNAPRVDITLTDGTKIFNDVGYKEYSNFISVDPGVYTLQVRPAGSQDVVLTIPNVQLLPGAYNSVYAIGLVGGQPPLEALLVNY